MPTRLPGAPATSRPAGNVPPGPRRRRSDVPGVQKLAGLLAHPPPGVLLHPGDAVARATKTRTTGCALLHDAARQACPRPAGATIQPGASIQNLPAGRWGRERGTSGTREMHNAPTSAASESSGRFCRRGRPKRRIRALARGRSIDAATQAPHIRPSNCPGQPTRRPAQFLAAGGRRRAVTNPAAGARVNRHAPGIRAGVTSCSARGNPGDEHPAAERPRHSPRNEPRNQPAS